MRSHSLIAAIKALRTRIESIPRLRLVPLPTPIYPTARLSHELGIELFVKRDDLTGAAFGGNKARNLEFRLAEALRQGATDIVVGLHALSNSARQTVSLANRLGLDTTLVLIREQSGSQSAGGVLDEPHVSESTGNMLVNRLMGADIRLVEDVEAQRQMIDDVVEDLVACGLKPHVLDRDPMFEIASALAYALCFCEVLEYFIERSKLPDYIYIASGGKGQAGLILARKLLEVDLVVRGISVKPESEGAQSAARIATAAAELLGYDSFFDANEVENYSDFAGEQYGLPTQACLQAVHSFARLEGLVLDPVYTGKAAAGLIEHAKSKVIEQGSTVVFVHTGGTPAIFTYAESLLSSIGAHSL